MHPEGGYRWLCVALTRTGDQSDHSPQHPDSWREPGREGQRGPEDKAPWSQASLGALQLTGAGVGRGPG